MIAPNGRFEGNPAMVELTSTEERVREFLLQHAQSADPAKPFRAVVTYGQLCGTIDPDGAIWKWPRFRGVGRTLAHVSAYEAEHGRPMLSALVVQKQTMRAGEGFAILGRDLGFKIQEGAERAFWRQQVEDLVRYWTGPRSDAEDAVDDPVRKAVAMLDSVMDQLAEIKRLLDTS
jgi:hypothetical protein